MVPLKREQKYTRGQRFANARPKAWYHREEVLLRAWLVSDPGLEWGGIVAMLPDSRFFRGRAPNHIHDGGRNLCVSVCHAERERKVVDASSSNPSREDGQTGHRQTLIRGTRQVAEIDNGEDPRVPTYERA